MPARKKSAASPKKAAPARAKAAPRAKASAPARPKSAVKPATGPKAVARPGAPARSTAPVPTRGSAPAPAKDVLEIDWSLFGELSRALALKVARDYDPDMVVGIATAGVIPGATIAAMLDCEFHSMIISRRYHADTVRDTPTVFGSVPHEVRGQHVLIVDETCDSGATMRLAVSAIRNAGARQVRTAVSFATGSYKPDYHALATDAEIVLPWDREILVDGHLVLNPDYEDLVG